MRIAAGPRPWAIHIFAIAFALVALIGLYLALAHPFIEWFKWTKRVPAVAWTQDMAVVAAFSVFTMSLFPLVWVYACGAARARWIVFGFGLVKVGLWVHAAMITELVGVSRLLRLAEPALILLALGCMAAPSSQMWLRAHREDNLASFD